MKKKRLADKVLSWSSGALIALSGIYFVGKLLGRKNLDKKNDAVHQAAPICEHCQKNVSRVRVERLNAGRRESQFLCQECVDELMHTAGING
ncbi:hypothetical protein [Dictyobacter kobayashii]|uniref:Uncharacterized protein n=1 Tax=Dictyobacter kobayashii TaxID=2014872 RepID=A0A402AZF2_9CHLR|nr:hypothetical protein [Dictyobacter kobayashii]GCE24471.1 hypothetical protein KDK_82710 [Dictyobacter kobayashii]